MANKVPSAKKGLGQHFLYDEQILNRIVKESGLVPGEAALEIGPGPGGLTRALVAGGARLWAVETDERMVEHLREDKYLSEVSLTLGDALKTDYLEIAREAGEPLRLVANLPYNISGPLLARLLRQRGAFKSMTLMFQREVADRIAATPGGKTRGRLSVISQAFFTVTKVMRVMPGAFKPPPKVESAVVHLEPLAAPPLAIDDEDTLWKVVAEGFMQRRKMLRNSLKGRIPDVEGFLISIGLHGRERAEELSVIEWIKVANEAARKK